ncbi:hypothetical protein OFN63_30235, partial [Escherichia coli]|nr:hypothetical protein [Escherichia coli]
ALIDGYEATLPLNGVAFEGSDLFDVLQNDADMASITIIPGMRQAVLKILAPQSACPIFEYITGQISAGRKQIRFFGKLFDGLLDVEIIFTPV